MQQREFWAEAQYGKFARAYDKEFTNKKEADMPDYCARLKCGHAREKHIAGSGSCGVADCICFRYV
jgi:hypothetical protein